MFSKNLETKCLESLKGSYHNKKNYEMKQMSLDLIAEKKTKKLMAFNEHSDQGRKYAAVV